MNHMTLLKRKETVVFAEKLVTIKWCWEEQRRQWNGISYQHSEANAFIVNKQNSPSEEFTWKLTMKFMWKRQKGHLWQRGQ